MCSLLSLLWGSDRGVFITNPIAKTPFPCHFRSLSACYAASLWDFCFVSYLPGTLVDYRVAPHVVISGHVRYMVCSIRCFCLPIIMVRMFVLHINKRLCVVFLS